VATIGLLTALGLLTTLELTGGILNGPDSAVLNWMLTHRSTHLTSAAVAVTNSGTSPLLYPSSPPPDLRSGCGRADGRPSAPPSR